jgi:hypothetical protein
MLPFRSPFAAHSGGDRLAFGGASYRGIMRRTLSSRQASARMGSGRLPVLGGRRNVIARALSAAGIGGSSVGSDTDSLRDLEDACARGGGGGVIPVGPSHPVSVPASMRPSNADGEAAVLLPGGVKPLPPRASGANRRGLCAQLLCRAPHAKSRLRPCPALPCPALQTPSLHVSPCARPPAAAGRAQREAQLALRLLRELLKRDYAVGYLFLSWLMRTSWVLMPAVATLLGLPSPTDKGARGSQVGALRVGSLEAC